MLGRLCPTSSTARPAASALLQAASLLQVQTAAVHHHKERHDLQRFLGITRSNKARANRNTHVNEKMFRKMRGRKTVLVDLPDDAEQRRLDTLPANQLRIEMLKKGINPYKDVSPRVWQESQFTMSSFYGVVDPYVAPESSFTLDSNTGSDLKERSLNFYHNRFNGTRRIRKKEGMQKFDPKTFGPTAEDIYIQAHKALQERNKQELHKFITENAYAKMWPDVEQGSIKWELVEWLEPSKVVTIRCADNPYKSGNDIAQLTVRMRSLQKLAVYDRFGGLILGSDSEPKEVVEYVVFENHIAVIDGTWRLHEKVYPKWSQSKEGSLLTQHLAEGADDRPTTLKALPLRAQELARERQEREKKGEVEEQ